MRQQIGNLLFSQATNAETLHQNHSNMKTEQNLTTHHILDIFDDMTNDVVTDNILSSKTFQTNGKRLERRLQFKTFNLQKQLSDRFQITLIQKNQSSFIYTSIKNSTYIFHRQKQKLFQTKLHWHFAALLTAGPSS